MIQLWVTIHVIPRSVMVLYELYNAPTGLTIYGVPRSVMLSSGCGWEYLIRVCWFNKSILTVDPQIINPSLADTAANHATPKLLQSSRGPWPVRRGTVAWLNLIKLLGFNLIHELYNQNLLAHVGPYWSLARFKYQINSHSILVVM